jgi:hypothetical protein
MFSPSLCPCSSHPNNIRSGLQIMKLLIKYFSSFCCFLSHSYFFPSIFCSHTPSCPPLTDAVTLIWRSPRCSGYIPMYQIQNSTGGSWLPCSAFLVSLIFVNCTVIHNTYDSFKVLLTQVVFMCHLTLVNQPLQLKQHHDNRRINQNIILTSIISFFVSLFISKLLCFPPWYSPILFLRCLIELKV